MKSKKRHGIGRVIDEGVEMARDTHDHLPATARQKQLIDELLRALPETKESYEYHDYLDEIGTIPKSSHWRWPSVPPDPDGVPL